MMKVSVSLSSHSDESIMSKVQRERETESVTLGKDNCKDKACIVFLKQINHLSYYLNSWWGEKSQWLHLDEMFSVSLISVARVQVLQDKFGCQIFSPKKTKNQKLSRQPQKTSNSCFHQLQMRKISFFYFQVISIYGEATSSVQGTPTFLKGVLAVLLFSLKTSAFLHIF